MARTASLLLLLSVILYITGLAITAAASKLQSDDTSYIEKSCKSTRYPTVCVQSLSPYAGQIQRSPRKMAQVALYVSKSRANSARSFVSKLLKLKNLKPKESKTTADCFVLLDDSVGRLSQSVKELNHTGQANDKDFSWHMSNVQTWVSAALTDENTCLDGFADKALDGKVKDSIRAKVVVVAQVTSNALALINKFAKTR